ncbi:hypothetical protein EOK75_10745 [Pseudorhodobacter turbinis]|uniref:Translocase n=1 Tax=Pseudorhodobacter turbinis TaxID=2500533 RepID=A0A4P8EHB5_9RHOB|nr:hypothetical protein [Pseudorhodobacter turbinis]QCO56162.1 hypothetical protein EOK75_10745 [Pseudorhodobacter turbinis]
MKRKIALAIATLAVTLGGTKLLQDEADGPTKQANLTIDPQSVTALAASLDPVDIVTQPPAVQAPVTIRPEAPPEAAVMPVEAPACPVALEVVASPDATLGLTLIAPCHVSERVVLRHGGLAVTAMTSATGALFTSLPGMEPGGEVAVHFNNGDSVRGAEPLPDLGLYRRFALQWVAQDRFELVAFKNGIRSGDEAAHNLQGLPKDGGYLSMLGDATTPLPMQAAVYTFPLSRDVSVDLTIEVAVTDLTCNRELLGEMLLSEAGVLSKTDLTMATPSCDAIGDILVMANPLPDLRLASAR